MVRFGKRSLIRAAGGSWSVIRPLRKSQAFAFRLARLGTCRALPVIGLFDLVMGFCHGGYPEMSVNAGCSKAPTIPTFWHQSTPNAGSPVLAQNLRRVGKTGFPGPIPEPPRWATCAVSGNLSLKNDQQRRLTASHSASPGTSPSFRQIDPGMARAARSAAALEMASRDRSHVR
jgi:hypothetical protein